MSWKLQRATRFETLESRLVMSAQALTDFVADIAEDTSTQDVDQFVETLSQTGSNLSDAYTDLESIREQYNLDGAGQTIAVIDSGIAFDHIAFGDGFGAGNRVVGGYDFAENDSNPYDDGPLGLHGTHVSGIIAGSSDEFTGVAPGADLVSLRVFDDNGAGGLDRIEQALQWVHDNQNSFENPITTVNLSIGTAFNSDTIPNVAQLEDEFAQLEADGIFISVAAGNLFQSFNDTGLSYPAVSPFVVPVASHGADGELSDFSQRNERVLVAPGENILSTVPDYVFAGAQTDGYLRTSGTSQAAPYVAGASALLRQAFESAGQDNVDQDFLYEHFRETADLVFDQATGANYHRINISAAIEAALENVPAQPNNNQGADPGVDTSGPVSLNNGVLTIQGTNANDQIQFSQGAVIDVALNGANYQFNAGDVSEIMVIGAGGQDSIDATFSSDLERAVLRVSNLNVTATDFQFTATGIENIDVNSTGDAGLLTIRDSVGVDIVNANYDEVSISGNGFSNTATGFSRVTAISSGGNDLVRFTGSEGSDRFITDDEGRSVLRNGESRLVAREFSRIVVTASAGHDVANLSDTAGNDLFELTGRGLNVETDNFQIWGSGFERIKAESTQGFDTVRIIGTGLADRLSHVTDATTLQTDLYNNTAIGFTTVAVFGNGGHDVANIQDSTGNDTFTSQGNQANFNSDFDKLFTNGFERVVVNANQGGIDRSILIGTVGRDVINATATATRLNNAAGIETIASRFEFVSVNARTGNDVSHLTGSAQRDVLRSLEGRVEFESMVQMLRIVNTENHHFNGNGGVDEAIFADFDTVDLLSGVGDRVTADIAGQHISAVDIDFLEARARDNGNPVYDFDSVDFLFLLDGNWQEDEG